MSTVASARCNLKAQWRSQMIRRRHGHRIGPRMGLAAISFADRSKLHAPFTEIGSVHIFVMYEDAVRAPDGTLSSRTPLRFGAYRASRVPHGVAWGGVANSALFKNVALSPQPQARGQRLDVDNAELLQIALDLDVLLWRASRHPGLRRPKLRLPRLWAGFRTRDSVALKGEGPEFERQCKLCNTPSEILFERTLRCVDGLTLCPLDWVSGKLNRSVAIFAQTQGMPKRQVAPVGQPPDGLMGFQGASVFDFYNSRFRRTRNSGSRDYPHDLPNPLVASNAMTNLQPAVDT